MHGPIDPAAVERAEERARLRRWRLYAGIAMAAMLAATVGLYAIEPPRAWWLDLLHAAAKAGFVGAVADWFARVQARPSFDEAITAFQPDSYDDQLRKRGIDVWPRVKALLAA